MQAEYQNSLDVDQADDGHLPSYQELAETAPPNSRFGRWREWIDKRAHERFADQTDEDRAARRERLGWGEGILASPTDYTFPSNTPPPSPPPPPASPGPAQPPTPETLPSVPSPLLPLGSPLPPTSLASYSFGSRFIPHSPLPILALLPLAASDRFLLLGTSEGLAVLDVLPRLHGAEPTGARGLEDARRREVWTGVGVCQCAVLEDATRDVGVAQGAEEGVVLMLVSIHGRGGEEKRRELRMYKLSSLLSLVRWTVSQEDSRPLDLAKSTSLDAPSPTKSPKDRARHRLSRPLRLEPTSSSSTSTSTASLLRPPSPQPPSRASSQRSTRSRASTTASPSASLSPSPIGWDAPSSLPYRWATDFEPFHHPRLPPTSTASGPEILFFELWKASEYGQFGRTMLAVATAKNVLLFEAPVGERAWTFVKEYYVPHPPRSAKFVYQSVSPPSAPPAPHASTLPTPYYPPTPESPPHSAPLPQLSLFLTFDKKSVLVRLSDAQVNEVDLWAPATASTPLSADPDSPPPPGTGTTRSLSRLAKHASLDPIPHDFPPPPLATIYIPSPTTSPSQPKLFYLLTRARHTHLYASPLPSAASLLSRPPLWRHTWTLQPPQEVVPRISLSSPHGPVLQLIAFGADGVELAEVALADALSGDTCGKGKAKAKHLAGTTLYEGFPAGSLCPGGEWDSYAFRGGAHPRQTLIRTDSDESVDGRERWEEKGVYCWVKRDVEDERVFWMGGKDRVE